MEPATTTNSSQLASTLKFRHLFDLIVFNDVRYLAACLVVLNIIIFHWYKLIVFLLILVSFLLGLWIAFMLNRKAIEREYDAYMNDLWSAPPFYQCLSDNESQCENSESDHCDSASTTSNYDQKSMLNIKPSLTGSYLIDDEIHKIIDLFIRDYVDSWYKANISDTDEFSLSVRLAIYNAIRRFNSKIKSLDYEHFIMNVLAHNLVIQMRILKKSKEKLNSNVKNSGGNGSVTSDSKQLLAACQAILNTREASLIEGFFDLEAEIEKGICRDEISMDTNNESERVFLQELSEMLCFYLFPSQIFNCHALKCLVRELFANFLLKYSIDTLADPDYINQSILYLCQDQAPSTENFLTTINNCESLSELSEILLAIEEEILKTRSNDKGGQNDQEIKLKLSSLMYVKRRIESNINHLTKTVTNSKQSSSPGNSSFSNSSSAEDENRTILFNQHLASLDFSLVVTNEDMQHCFIEFMGKQNVQNLISFYLNADMYRQFAKKEFSKLFLEQQELEDEYDENKLTARINESKETLRDFAKGLVNSYLLNASNFISTNEDIDDKPVNLVNQAFYKQELAQAIEHSENLDFINETLLDDLQAKIYLLMKHKYYPEFKNYLEFHKLLHKNDLLFKVSAAFASASTTTHHISSSLNTNQQQSQQQQKSIKLITNPIILSQHLDNNVENDISQNLNSESETSFDSDRDGSFFASLDNENHSPSSSDNLSQCSFDLSNMTTSSLDSSFSSIASAFNNNFNLTAIITSCGRCNELKTTYAIYIIDVTKEYDKSTGKKTEFWQTYRRFNDFHDLHLIMKKKFPSLHQHNQQNAINLPTKSLRTNLNDEFLEKRRQELNKYLQNLCNPYFISNNPQVLPLILKFLENKRWENSQTNFKRRVDSFLSPMITSVNVLQSSIKNAPENVIGIVKGLSDSITPSTSSTTSLTTPVSLTNQQTTSPSTSSNNLSTTNSSRTASNASSKLKVEDNELNSIHKTILNADEIQSDQLPVRVFLLLIDEIFDLKEKNQWLRQSLLAIVKSIMKNFRSDSMNRKIKEQIADFLSEEYVARYLKNFRKRMWPKGILADKAPEQSVSAKEITKILVKTKLLALVPDELRHILGNDTTRRGVFDVFDLFQHKPLNKRLLYILIENLVINLFQDAPKSSLESSPSLTSISAYQQTSIANSFNLPSNSSTNLTSQANTSVQSGPLSEIIRLHLANSSRVKAEWKNNNISSTSSNRQEDSDMKSMNGTAGARKQIPGSVSSSNISLSNYTISSSASTSTTIAQSNSHSATVNIASVKGKPSNNSNNNNDTTSITRSKSLFSEIQC